MKIKSEFLVTKVELKKSKDDKAYMMVSLLDLVGGDLFEVLHKEIEDMQKLQAMSKQEITLNLSSSKYGLKLDIVKIGEITGNILDN
ncbi:MAG: hypothetical protein ACRDDY_16130 [Clostridium sp.]|uniref:hypothetical protein n=1 Tax=Clostridium sp. TaxID=1506 RepID=UPI003EE7D157